MLGETGTEQFTITTTQDGKLIHEQKVHDPFVHSTTTICISRWDLFKALFQKQCKIVLRFHLSGTLAVTRAIMTLDPFALEAENQKIRDDYAIGRTYLDTAKAVNAG